MQLEKSIWQVGRTNKDKAISAVGIDSRALGLQLQQKFRRGVNVVSGGGSAHLWRSAEHNNTGGAPPRTLLGNTIADIRNTS